jgi:hypothetical protein
VDGVTHGAHRERLCQAGHAFEQHVAARQQTNQDPVDHVSLTHDDLGDLRHEVIDEGAFFGDDFV